MPERFAIVKILALFGISNLSCQAPEPEMRTPLSEQEAIARLEELRGTRRSLRGVAPVSFPDGEFAYVKGRLESDGRVGEKIAVYTDGSVLTHDQAKRRYGKEYYERWGALDMNAAALTLEEGASTASLPFSVWYRPEAREHVEAVLHKMDSRARFARRAPVATIRARLDEVRIALSLDPDVERIEYTPASGIRLSGDADDGPAAYSSTRTQFNDVGEAAAGVKVGIFEPLYDQAPVGSQPFCELNLDHDALRSATVTYLGSYDPANSNDTCSTPSDCRHCVAGWCMPNGKCIAGHASRVASRISARVDSEELHASKAHIYVHTDWRGDNFDFPTFTSVYDDFMDENVWIVNESQDAGGDLPVQYDAFDHYRDWIVRWNKVTVTKASGNYTTDQGDLVCSGGSAGSDHTAECFSLNAICVGALNAEGSTTDHTDDTLPCWSNWENPKFGGSSTRKEAERPDIVTEGEEALVLGDGSTSAWQEEDGTSFSAPVIAGMIALNEGLCGYDETKPNPPVNYKTLLRTGAYTRTSAATGTADIYPIPGHSADAHAGAGLPLAGSLYISCDMEAPNPGEDDPEGDPPQEGEIDPDDPAWFSAPAGVLSLSEDSTDTVTYGEWSTIIGGLKNANTQFLEIGSLGAVSEGTRIRATFSYYTCPSDSIYSTGTTDVEPAIDFDLVLCDLTTSPIKCPGISQSNDDTSEGFDVLVPTNLSNLKFYLVKDGSATYNGCNYYYLEPYAFQYLFWVP